MKKTAAVLIVLFIILLTTQLIRHTYTRIFSSQKSVLDQYKPKKSELQLDSSLSLNELSMIYADAVKRIKLLESGKSKKALTKYDSSDDPYSRKTKIEEMINDRESDYKNIMELIFFWITGLVLIAGGSFIYYRFETSIGASLVITGFIEMIWRTGPLFFMAADKPESLMLLNVKLIFTAITLASLIVYWFFTKNYYE